VRPTHSGIEAGSQTQDRAGDPRAEIGLWSDSFRQVAPMPRQPPSYRAGLSPSLHPGNLSPRELDLGKLCGLERLPANGCAAALPSK